MRGAQFEAARAWASCDGDGDEEGFFRRRRVGGSRLSRISPRVPMQFRFERAKTGALYRRHFLRADSRTNPPAISFAANASKAPPFNFGGKARRSSAVVEPRAEFPCSPSDCSWLWPRLACRRRQPCRGHGRRPVGGSSRG